MQALVAALRERFDYVLIDCPAGIELGFKNAVAGAEEAIVVCTPEVSAVRDVDRVVGLLGNRFRPQLVINRLRPQLVKKGKMLSVEDVNAILRLPLLGVIADEPEIIVTTNRGEPLALRKENATGAAYHAIAARLAGDDVPPPMPPAREADAAGAHRLARREEALMIEFLRRLFGHHGSSATAKERLRLVLMTDHLELAPEMIEHDEARSRRRDLAPRRGRSRAHRSELRTARPHAGDAREHSDRLRQSAQRQNRFRRSRPKQPKPAASTKAAARNGESPPAAQAPPPQEERRPGVDAHLP